MSEMLAHNSNAINLISAMTGDHRQKLLYTAPGDKWWDRFYLYEWNPVEDFIPISTVLNSI